MKCDSTKILAVLLLFLPSLGMAAEHAMGRLFFTSEQRARMDVARQQERSIKIDMDPQENEPPFANITNITLNGVIARSDGKTTVWINNKEQGGEKAGVAIVLPRRGGPVGQVSVITSDTKRAVPLKVGQSIDMSSGRVEDAYRRTPPQADKKEAPPSMGLGVDNLPDATAKSLPRNREVKDKLDADAQGALPSPR